MPYIAIHDGRYLCEHSCGREHYGRMDLVRPCCVNDAREQKKRVLRYALTSSHPASTAFGAAWSSLTATEQRLVGDIRQHHGYANGFEDAQGTPS